MDFGNNTVKFSDIKQSSQLADLYSKIYGIPRPERVKVLMSWLANAYSDCLIPFLPENEVLASYNVHVRLLDTFANNSSYDVVAQLASEFAENFILAQVIPNLLEINDKTADVTYYIQIICENLSCPSLIRKLMDIVTTKLTPILIVRMMSDDHIIASATLSLIKTLLELYCEDLWYDLILQYLLPMKHVLTSQRQKMIPDIEFHESTNKLLTLIPERVTNTISTSIIAKHFLLYFQDEITRLRGIDTVVASAPPSSKSDLQRVDTSLEEFSADNSTRKPGGNPTYPMWIFRYDGTDFLHALRKGYFQEPEEFFEDDLFSVVNQLNSSSTVEGAEKNGEDGSGNLSRSLLSDDESSFDLATVSVSGELDTNGNLKPYASSSNPINSLSTTPDQRISKLWSIVKDKRKSIESLEDTHNGAYFGPFLNALHEILKNWTVLEPDVLFTATEVISVLASSRIPLINTLFLDMSIILQPSYPSFSTLIHSVKNSLDEQLNKYPDYLLRNVWKSAGKECSMGDDELDSNEPTFTDDESFVNTLKRTITANKTFRMATEEVQRTMKIGRSSSFKAFTDIFKTKQNSTRPSEFRLLNRTAAPFESEEEERSAKIMALRCVLFSHWMLELGAIAMQLCWGRRSFHGNQQANTHNYNNDAEIGDSLTTAS